MTSDHRHAASLWLLCWFVYSLHWTPFLIREHLPAITLAEQGTLDVGRFANLSEDVFRTAGGGTYINNNPGASILAAVPLRLTRGLTDAIRRWNLGRPKPTVSPDLEPALYRTAVEERTEWYYLAICLITTAGVMASFASVGDLIIAEPAAMIGFAGCATSIMPMELIWALVTGKQASAGKSVTIFLM